MENWEKDKIIKRLNDDFFITIEDPSDSFYPVQQQPMDTEYPEQAFPDQFSPEHVFSEDPDQDDPNRAQSYIHQTKSSSEERSTKVRFSG